MCGCGCHRQTFTPQTCADCGCRHLMRKPDQIRPRRGDPFWLLEDVLGAHFGVVHLVLLDGCIVQFQCLKWAFLPIDLVQRSMHKLAILDRITRESK